MIRGFSDGVVSVVLASYLTSLGFTPLAVGAIVTGTMLGSAALTLAVGLWGGHFNRRRVLLAACALMLVTGIGFAGVTSFWPLFVIAVVGTLNPSSGDVSVFLPTEQAVLSQSAAPLERTSLVAWYNLAGSFSGALGALASGIPAWLAHLDLHAAERWAFVVYAATAVLAALFYRRLTTAIESPVAAPRIGLQRSRAIVIKLSALFSLDSMGGGFVVQSLLVIRLCKRFACRSRRWDRSSSSPTCAPRSRSWSRRGWRRASASSRRWSTRTCLRACCSS